MEFSLERYYRLNRLLLSIIGLWPYQRAADVWIRLFVISSLIWATITQIVRILVTELTADFIFDCLPVLISSAGSILQFLNRVMINDQLSHLLDQIKADWEHVRSQDEIKIMQTYAAEVRKITISFSLYVMGCSSIYIFITFVPQILDIIVPLNESRSREHPFHAEMFMDEKKYFYFIRFQMYFILMLVLVSTLANGTMFAICTHHASGMFTTLGHRAELLFNDDEYSSKTWSTSETEKDYANIVLFVEDHRNVLQFVDVIQSCYGTNLFLEFSAVIILMGLTLLQIKFSEMSDRPIRSVLFVSGQLLYLFIYSYMGQNIIDTSTQLFVKIYYGMWHNMSIWKRKMMLFIMMKCSRAISVKMCYVNTLSLENFSATVQMALSFFMLLLHI